MRARRVLNGQKPTAKASGALLVLGKKWQHWQSLTSILAVLLANLVNHGLAANPNAGLPSAPDYASYQQMKTNWNSRSLSVLLTNAQNGVPAAQTDLAERYASGDGVESNAAVAVEWYKKAAASGFALAQNSLGAVYEHGYGVQKDMSEAMRWYRLAADQGLPVAFRHLGRISLAQGTQGLRPKDSLHYYELAAEQGDLESAVQLGWLYSRPPWGGGLDMEKASYWFHFAASKGYVRAYSGLGWYYMREQVIGSQGLGADESEARRWFALGAEQDNASCDYGMAMLELRNQPDEKNHEEVRKWLLKAAAQDYSAAFYQLGQLSENATPPDYSEAAKWYQQGLEADDGYSTENLTKLVIEKKVKPPGGDMIAFLRRASDKGAMGARVELAMRYFKGEGQPRNDADTTLALLESASNTGNTRALLQLSDFYRTGKLVKKDVIQAVNDLFLAAALQFDDAYERIQKLGEGSNRQDKASGDPQDWQQAFTDFVRAVQTSKPEPAALLARRYLDGTYSTNLYQAVVWYSVAAGRHDEAAAAEVKRLEQQLDKADQAKAKAQAEAVRMRSITRLPGL